MLYAYLGDKTSASDQAQLVTNLPSHIAIDVETVDLSGTPIGLAIAPNANEAYWFDINEPIWRELTQERTAIYHNAHYDVKQIDWKGEFEDTYLMYLSLGHEHLSLKALAWEQAMLEFPTAKELMKKYKAKNMLGVPKLEVANMCCLHARATYAIWERVPFIPKIYYMLDKKMIPVLLKIEEAGLYVDQEETTAQIQEVLPLRNEALSNFQSIYGLINLNSPLQLQKALGIESTNKSVLERINFAGKQHLIDYRKYNTLLSTFYHSFQKKTDSNGRIHTRLDYTRTARFRSGGSKDDPSTTNLQNIPKGEIRRCIASPKGFSLIDGDYSQLELRVLAHVANETVMINAFDKGKDLHQLTADEVFLNSNMRHQAKTLNFALVYGAEAHKIMELVGCTYEEALVVQQRLFATYPNFAKCVRQVKTFARSNLFVETMFGRRRQISELADSNAWVRAHGLREAFSTMIQSPAADIVKLAMLELMDYNMIMQIHDELIFEEEESIAESLVPTLKEIAESSYPLRTHLTCEFKVGKNYLEVH